MNAQNEPGSHLVYEFGGFRLDGLRRLLYAKGSPEALAVKPKVLEALLYFVQHPGELLDKDRLLSELWPGIVVEENGLTQVISSLRRVLGEAPGENRYLTTVPGRGYCFVADVALVPDRAAGEPQPEAVASPLNQSTIIEPPTTAHRAASSRPTPVVALLALATALGVGLALYAGIWSSRTARETTDTAASSSPTAVDLPANTVAVLPFENLSVDADDAYVAFGVAESVLHRLAGIRGLTVIARTSSFALGEHPADVRDVGRKLNARYLVEGSVQRSDDRLRATAQLIDAATGGHVWSLRFDRRIDDIFAVEDEIARNIATALEVSLDRDKHPYAAFGTDAYLEYLQGRTLMATSRIEDADRAIEHFSRAVRIAPDFAAAYAALANAHWQRTLLEQTSGTGFAFFVRSDRQRERLTEAANEAQPWLERALQLDETLAEAYILRADLKWHRGDNAGAEADYRTGLEYNPSYGTGHERYAALLSSGRRDKALKELDEAIRVDPLAPRNHYLKGALRHQMRLDDVEPHLLKALVLAPDYHPALLRLGLIRWREGRFAEAIRLGERALSVDPRAEWIRWPLAQFYLEVGDVDAARSVLLEAPETVPPSDWLAICVYDGKPLRAAELLRADSSYRYFVDLDLRGYALRDAARLSGRYAQARQDLLILPSYHGPGEDHYTAVARAQVSLALGDRGEAESLARELSGGDNPEDNARAAALTLLAQNDAALDVLENGYAQVNRSRWWYTFQRDMGFEALRGDLRFQALATKAAAHAAAEGETLRQMRERGDVPKRSTSDPSGAGPC